MQNTTGWDRFKEWAFGMAGVFAELAIGIPGVIIAFENNLDNRWAVLVLTTIFLVLSVVYASLRDRHASRLINAYLVVETILATVLLYLNPFLTFYIIWFYVLSIEAIMALPRRRGLGWLAFYTVLTVVLLVWLLPLGEAMVSLPIFLGGFFFFVTFANATYQANESRKETQRLLAELQTAHRKLQEFAVKSEQLAVSEERNRLSREMHDTVGHRLTVSSVQLEALQKLVEKNPKKAAEIAAIVRDQVREALQELRRTVAQLREPIEADLPLEISIDRLVHSFEEATGLDIQLLLPDAMPDLPNGHRLAVYRTAQEALTNVQKHAEATRVWLQMEFGEGRLILRVSDNGKGLSGDPEGGFGLRGIRERAVQLGGEFFLETRRGGGTQLSLHLPLVGR